jgi:ribonuclease P protein component
VQIAIPHLKRRQEFVRVAREGRSWATPGLVLQVWRPNDCETVQGGADAMRLGITVTRKVGKAVARNRIRRRLREAARFVLPRHAAPDGDYVLIGRPATLQRTFTLLVSDLGEALRRLGAWRSVTTSSVGPINRTEVPR